MQLPPISALPRGCWGSAEARRSELQLRAVNVGSHSNDGFGSDSGPSRGEPCRRAFRPTEAPDAATCYVRLTSKPVRLTTYFDAEANGLAT